MRKLVAAVIVVLLVSGAFFLGTRMKSEPAPGQNHEKQLWTCGMHPQVIQDKPGICPICEMKLTPLRQDNAKPKAEKKIKYWWDPMMNPPYISDAPGKSPMGMDLVPVYEDEVASGPTVTIDPAVVQNMGIRTARVTEGPLRTIVRAVGYFREAEPNQHDISLKVGGWIEKLYADTEGKLVAQGEPLFEVYSPDLFVAQEELIAATRALKKQTSEELRRDAQQLVENARRKLELWNVAVQDIDAIAQAERAQRALTFRSPISGHVVEKMIVQGSSVQSGEKLLRIVDHSVLWLDIQLFEYQLPLVAIGQKAVASVRGVPGKTFSGQVTFIHPHVDPTTRAASARLAFENPGFELKPGMYATAEFQIESAERTLLVPREAVIDTGVRQVAFVVREAGHFEPRDVQMGIETSDGTVQILKGLAAGEVVVTSGQFLLDVESRMREAIQKMLKPQAPEKKTSAEFDGIIKAYLEFGKMLAMDHPADPSALIEAARNDVEVKALAKDLQGAGLDDQRKQFKRLSDALIRRIDQSSLKLFVMYCSMYPGSWIQSEEEISNPYYGSSMLRCGEVSRKLND